MSERRSIDSIFRTISITTKEAGTSFNTSPKNNSNNKKRKSLSSFFSNFHITKPSLQKLSSIYLIITVLFQSMAGLFLFSPVPQAKAAISWYNTSYSYRKQITIDRTKIPHTDTNNTNPYLTDFPVLVSLTDDNLKFAPNGKVQKEDGSDIIFANQSGTTLLNYETESYDKDNGTINAWVKIPQLNDTSNTQDTVIYMYYGNNAASANTEANIQGVWDSNFKMVQHMNQSGTNTAGDYKDSTANSNNSTNTSGQPTVTAGKIGKAESFDGTNQYMDMGNKDSLKTGTGIFTEGAWVKWNDVTGEQHIVNKGSARQFFKHTSNNIYFGDSAAGAISSSSINVENWYYIVGVYNGNGTEILYLNGIQVGLSTKLLLTSDASNFFIGSYRSAPNYVLNGSIDEVRISNTARSDDWIKAEYANQSTPSTFLSVGSEEDSVTPPSLSEITPVSTPTNDTTPTYTFSSTKSGEITYEGDCSSSTTFANTGNNTITFNSLSVDTHSNCTITVTDAAGNTSSVLDVTEFTINPNYTWYSTSYSYRKQITIDRTKIPHTDTNNANPYLTDFPVLVSLTDDNLKLAPTGKVQKEEGSDIIFANQSGTTLLNYETESYDKDNGTINAWVKIPQLNDINNTQDTVIYMYYGNANASANTEANIQGVWDSNFKMVQHMNQSGTNTAGDYKDSTVNNNYSINTTGQPTAADGKIGKAETFDGVDDFINFGSSVSLNLNSTNSFTFQLWAKDINTAIANGYAAGLLIRNYSNGYGMDYYPYNNQVRAGTRDTVNGSKDIAFSPSDNLKKWNYLVFIYTPNDLQGIKIYDNGELQSTLSTVGFSYFAPTTNVTMGTGILGGGTAYFNGLLDEARISSTARSSDWINAEYTNQFTPSTFYTLSSEQSVSVPSFDHFTITGSSTQTSGSSQSLTLTAINYEGSILSSYTGDKQVTFSGANVIGANNPAATDKDGNLIPFNTPITITFNNGVAYTNITLYKAETAGIGISDNDNYSSSGYNLPVTVSSRDEIRSIGINAPLFAVSNNSFSLTLSMEDSYGNIINNPTSPVALSTNRGNISPSSIPASSFTNGSYTGNFTITNVTQNTDAAITATYGSITSSITIPIRGIAQMDHFAITKADIQPEKDADIIIGKQSETNPNFFLTSNYADDAACIQAALDSAASGDTVLIRQGDYQIDRQVSQTGKDLNIIGEGEVKMHVNFAGQVPGLYLHGTQIKQTSFIADASKGTDIVYLQDASGILAGDLVRLSNNILWCPNDYPTQKVGEMYVVKSVSENAVVLEDNLLRDYAVTSGSKIIAYHPIKINIRNLSFYGTGAEGDGRATLLQYCKDSSVIGNYYTNNGLDSLLISACSNVEARNNVILNSNMTGLGYGIAIGDASSNIRIHGNLIRNCRHAIMSGNSDYLDLNRDVYIQNNTLYQDTGKATVIDSHQTTINYFVTGNTVYANVHSAFGDGTQYSIFANNIIYGGIGAVSKRGYVANATKIITRNTALGTSLLYGEFPNTEDLYIADNYVFGEENDSFVSLSHNQIDKIIARNNIIEGMYYPFQVFTSTGTVSNLTISNNQISNPRRSAAYISYAIGSSGTLSLYNNTIHNASSSGVGSNAIELHNVKDSLIAGNHITDDNHKTLYGIYEDSGSSNNNIFQNASSSILGQTLFSQSTTTNLNEGTIPTDTPVLYPLTVENGTGSGSYEVGEEVSITANIPQNKIFDRWTGDIGYISDIYSPSAIATLPQEPITLIPTYKDIDTIKKGEIITVNIKAMSTGKDSFVDYTGDKQVVFSGANKEGEGKTAIRPTASDKDGKDIPFGYSTTLTFRNGIATSNIKLYKGETAYINITDGTYTSFNDQTYSFPLTVQTENSSTPSFPPKPSAQDMSAIFKDGAVSLTNLPNAIKQIAVSLTNDFIHSSWIAIEDMENILKSYTNTDKLYLKLRTDTGAVSDTITYTPQTSNTDTTNPDTTNTLQDGDIVKTPSSPDIYVIKIQNSKKYKRLILSPHVFNSYQHLKWENIKTISEEQLNQYQTSSLVKEATDTIIYTLTPNGDQGQRKPFDITQTYDPDSIYTINKVDRDSYEWEE